MAQHADDAPRYGVEIFREPEKIRPLAHPTRMRIYADAVRGEVSAKELAARYEQPLARISYHVRALADAGLLQPVRRTQRRGAVETHYRAIATIDVDDEALRELPEDVRRTWFGVGVRMVAEDLLAALDEDAMDEPDFLLTRAHFVTTAEGRERLQAEIVRIYERLGTLARELAAEAAEAGEGAQHLNLVLAQYAGERRAGRNGPFVVAWDPEDKSRQLQTIPEE